MTKAEKHMGIVASLGCVLCRRDTGKRVPCQVHHIAEGSGARSDYMVAGLCYDHHQGEAGIHGLGTKRFLMLFNLPSEHYLLELVNKYRIIDGV